MTTARNKAFWFMLEPLVISKDTWTQAHARPAEDHDRGRRVARAVRQGSGADGRQGACRQSSTKAGAKVADMDEAPFLKWRRSRRRRRTRTSRTNVKNGQELARHGAGGEVGSSRLPWQAAGSRARRRVGGVGRFRRGLEWFNTVMGYLSAIVIVRAACDPLRGAWSGTSSSGRPTGRSRCA